MNIRLPDGRLISITETPIHGETVSILTRGPGKIKTPISTREFVHQCISECSRFPVSNYGVLVASVYVIELFSYPEQSRITIFWINVTAINFLTRLLRNAASTSISLSSQKAGDWFMCEWTWHSFLEIIASCQFDTTSLHEPMLTFRHLNNRKQTSKKM